jgi:hypothetical protein
MRARTLIGAMLVLLAAAGAAVAAVVQSPGVATVTLSPAAARAWPVTVTVQLPAALQCGRPMGGPVSVTLPRGERMPSTIAATAVRVNGLASSKVAVTGRVVTVALPVRRGITCMSIIEGSMKIVFAPAAGLGNPSAAGTYTVIVRQGKTGYLVPVSIKG